MVVVEHVPSDVDRIILVSRAKRYSRVVDLPSFNSEGSDVTIEILPAKASSGLQTNTAMDEDGLTLEHVAESMGLRPEIRIEQNSDDGGDPDLPTLEDIKKSMGLGR